MDRLPAQGQKPSAEPAYRLVSPSPALIVGHLMRVFQIPHGAELALVLAPEGPACNERALRYWVGLELGRMADGEPVDQLLVALEERLLSKLRAIWPDEAGAVDVPSPAALASELPMPYWEATETCARRGRGKRVQPARNRDSKIHQFMDQAPKEDHP